jgi:hypothetical protein
VSGEYVAKLFNAVWTCLAVALTDIGAVKLLIKFLSKSCLTI